MNSGTAGSVANTVPRVATWRRIAGVLLLAVGGVFVAWAARACVDDWRRAAVVAALAIVGMSLNVVAGARPTVSLRPLLRILGLGMALVLTAATLGVRWHLTQGPATPPMLRSMGPDEFLRLQRAGVERDARNLSWTAAALGYVAVSILLLPPAGTAARPRPAEIRPG